MPSREIEALLLVARSELSPERRERLRALVAGGLEWDALRSAASFHRLVPLLSHHLRAVAADLAPPEVLSSLRRGARTTLIANIALAAEMRAVVAALELRGIEPIVFKGPAVAQMLYGNLGMRPFGDVDLLVLPERAAEACHVLTARGYEPRPDVPLPWRPRLIRHHHEQTFESPHRGVRFDLHWELHAPGYTFDLAQGDVRARAASFEIAGGTYRTAGAEHTLLFLALHSAQHGWSCLGRLCDVALLLQTSTRLDWERIACWSAVPGPRRPLQLALHLASRLLEAPAPEAVLSQGARDPSLGPLIERVTARLLSPAPWLDPRPSLWAGLLDSVWYRCLERRSDRLRHVYHLVLRPMPADMIAVPLPCGWPVLFLTRPVRLLWRQALRTIGSRRARAANRRG